MKQVLTTTFTDNHSLDHCSYAKAPPYKVGLVQIISLFCAYALLDRGVLACFLE